jgi:hypothetical protein
LFSIDSRASRAIVVYERVSAKSIEFQESWYRDTIAASPNIIIDLCRQAGLVASDEEWLCWKTEASTDVGPIDVLLVSSRGRVCIVETKLASNPEKRREVIAQILDYAIALQGASLEDLPALPVIDGKPFTTESYVRESLMTGEFLLVVAGDELDPRAIRLSKAVLATHIANPWDLAMVDLNIYCRSDGGVGYLMIPELRGVLVQETRIKVVVEGAASVQIERAEPDSSARQEWDEERYFTAIANSAAPILALAEKLRDSSSPAAVYGSGKNGCIGLAFNGKATINLYVDGRLAAKPLTVLQRAVGSGPAQVLSQGLANLFGDEYGDSWKMVPAAQTMARVSDLLGLIDRLVAEVKRQH